MISVQSHQQLLSGSKYIFFFLLMVLSGCGILKPSQDSRTDKKKDPVVLEDMDTKVDTLRFDKIPEDEFPPIILEPSTSKEDPFEMFKKDKYHLALFIPFEAKEVVLPEDLFQRNSLRFANYYAGIKLALQDLEEKGLALDVRVLDSERSELKVKEAMDRISKDTLDLIIGPYNREGLQITAQFGKEHNITVISPWLASTRVTDYNPYYVQLRPSLVAHYFKMIDHINQNFNQDEIMLIGRNIPADTNRFRYFQETYRALNPETPGSYVTEFLIAEDSLNYGTKAFDLLNNTERKAVIIPNWGYNDEDFIYACLRRLNIERGDTEVFVYGMPIIFDSDKIDFDFYTNLNIRIVLSEFTDWTDPRVREFEKRYFEIYGDLPTSDAFEGYDMMSFIGNNLLKYGLNFHLFLEDDKSRYLQTAFDIYKVFDEEDERMENIKYFENKHLDLIQYIGNKFVKIE